MSTIFRHYIVTNLVVIMALTAPVTLRGESLEIKTLVTLPINPANGVHPLWTPVQHFKGKTFVVAPDVNLRPFVTQIDRTGKIISVSLDSNPDYKATPDGHNRFTMGIDKSGYIHIAGDMHGFAPWARTYVRRYQRQNMMYWRSNKPLDVTAGFTFTGGLNSQTSLPGEEWGGDSRFFNDKNGELYFSSRVRAFTGGTLSGSEPFIAYGIYRYNSETGRWKALGGTVEKEVPGAQNFNRVLYWEHTGSFEAYQCVPRFDNNNRLHFALGGNTAGVKGQGLIYAFSDDFGETWKKADGTAIPGLPIRGRDNERNQGDLVLRSEQVAQQSPVYIDKTGSPALNVAGVWKHWNGQKWVKFSGGKGILGPDGKMSEDSGQVIFRASGFDQPAKDFKTPFGQIFSFSELGLQVENALYGIGLPQGTNFVSAKKMSVFRAQFSNLKNLSGRGQATAGSDSQNAKFAFDKNKGSKWYTDKKESEWWLKYSFEENKKYKVTQYELTSGNDVPGRDPMEWSFEGSNDGKDWLVLDQRASEKFDFRLQSKVYKISNPKLFCQYRLRITANRGGSNDSMQISELELMGIDESKSPEAPRIFYCSEDDKKVWLSWTEPEGAVSFKVMRSQNRKGPYKTIASGKLRTGEFTDDTCINGEIYYYKISAVNSSGESPDSNIVKATPSPAKPLTPIILSANGRNRGMLVSWLPLWQNSENYTVKRSTKINGTYETVAENVKSLTYYDRGLSNGQSYFYKVTAVSKDGTKSKESSPVKGSPFQWVSVLKYNSIGYVDPGTATASSENKPRETAAQAFDDSLNSKWLIPKKTGWLQYTFKPGHEKAVTRYILVSGQDAPDRDPKSWVFQGSLNGNDWTDLDGQNDQVFKGRNTKLTFSFNNDKKFRFYRLKVTDNAGSGITQLAELQLWADGEIKKD